MTRHHLGLHRAVVTAGLFSLALSSAARAAIEYSGDVSPDDPSSWTSSTNGFVGNTGSGSINVTGGSVLNTKVARVGDKAGSSGVVTVTGSNSSWTANEWLWAGFNGNSEIHILNGASGSFYQLAMAAGTSESLLRISGNGTTVSVYDTLKVGDSGRATMTVSDGAIVTSQRGHISANYGRTSSVTVEGTSSKWIVSTSLSVAGNAYSKLVVRDQGQIEAVNFLLDAAIMASTLVDGAGSSLRVSALNTGLYGNGELTVTNGGTVEIAGASELAKSTGRTASILVTGAGSTFVAKNTMKVGSQGSAAIDVRHGATATMTNIVLGDVRGGFGLLAVDGAASVLNHDVLVIGASGKGEFRIANGATVNTGLATLIGQYASAAGSKAIADGVGTTWNLADKIEIGGQGSGTLSVTNGAEITAHWIGVSSQSALTMDIGNGSRIILRDSIAPGNPQVQQAFFRNNGLVRMTAAANVAAGTYTPITAAIWLGSGTYQAIGGRWDNLTHQFIVSAAINGSAGQSIQMNLADTQRVIITDSNGKRLGLSFAASDSPGELVTFTASTFSSSEIGSLLAAAGDDMAYLAGWDVQFDGAAPTAAYVSIEIGAGQKLSDLAIWHFDGEAWTLYDADDLNYDGQFAHFLADGFSGYAVTTAAVPEPATAAVLAIAATGMLLRRRR